MHPKLSAEGRTGRINTPFLFLFTVLTLFTAAVNAHPVPPVYDAMQIQIGNSTQWKHNFAPSLPFDASIVHPADIEEPAAQVKAEGRLGNEASTPPSDPKSNKDRRAVEDMDVMKIGKKKQKDSQGKKDGNKLPKEPVQLNWGTAKCNPWWRNLGKCTAAPTETNKKGDKKNRKGDKENEKGDKKKEKGDKTTKEAQKSKKKGKNGTKKKDGRKN